MSNRTMTLKSLNANYRFLMAGALAIIVLSVGYLAGSIVKSAFSSHREPTSANLPAPGGGALVDPPYLLHDFTLTSHLGEPISLSDFRGKAVMLFFGYTHCPDVCPTTLADYSKVKEGLGETADETAFVFISVDGARDAPDVLRDYLSQYDSDFVGMTADETTLRQIGSEYGLVFAQDAINVEHEHEDGFVHDHNHDEDGYFVNHTSPSFLVDRNGYLRMVYFYGTEPSVVADGIKQILAQ